MYCVTHKIIPGTHIHINIIWAGRNNGIGGNSRNGGNSGNSGNVDDGNSKNGGKGRRLYLYWPPRCYSQLQTIELHCKSNSLYNVIDSRVGYR